MIRALHVRNGRLLMDMGPGVAPQFMSLFGAISIAPTGQVTLTDAGTITTAGTGLSLSGGGSTLNLALTNATLQTNVTAETTLDSTNVMVGLGSTCKITPVYSSRIHVAINGAAANNTAGDTVSLQARFGTGTPPAVAATPSGTTLGGGIPITSASAGAGGGFTVGGIITGLTVGTQVWFDMSGNTNGGVETLAGLSCTAFEFFTLILSACLTNR